MLFVFDYDKIDITIYKYSLSLKSFSGSVPLVWQIGRDMTGK